MCILILLADVKTDKNLKSVCKKLIAGFARMADNELSSLHAMKYLSTCSDSLAIVTYKMCRSIS